MDSHSLLKRVALLAFAVGLGAFPSAQAAAQNVEFSGKRINVIVPAAPGSGTDVYMRTIAPYLETYLPGHPTVLVRNDPGGGSIVAANDFQAKAKPDGTDAMVVSASTIANYVFKKSIVRFKLDTWQPVIISPQGTVVYVAPNLGVSQPQELPRLKDKVLVFGGRSATSGDLRVIVPLHMLGLKPKYVWGLERGPARLAFERSEFNINFDSAPAYIKDVSTLVKAGKAVPLFSLGVLSEEGRVVRDPNFKNLPSFPEAYEMMNGKPPSGPAFDAWRALFQMGVMADKSIFLPAKTAKPVVEAWRVAMRKVFADPKFAKAAQEIVGGYPQFFGDAARPIMKEATTLPPEAWDWIKNYLKTEQNVAL